MKTLEGKDFTGNECKHKNEQVMNDNGVMKKICLYCGQVRELTQEEKDLWGEV